MYFNSTVFVLLMHVFLWLSLLLLLYIVRNDDYKDDQSSILNIERFQVLQVTLGHSNNATWGPRRRMP